MINRAVAIFEFMTGFDELSIDNVYEAELDFGRRRGPNREVSSFVS